MYKIVGADQKEYGPVTEEQLRQWIAEGRANAQTLVKFGDGPWKALSTFPEFAAALGTLPPPPTAPGSAPLPPLAPSPLVNPGANAPTPINGMAIGGLVCSILGVTCGMAFCCGPLFSTLGLVLSMIALSQINGDPAKFSGRGIAVAGIVLAIIGYLEFALLLSTGVLGHMFRRFPRHF